MGRCTIYIDGKVEAELEDYISFYNDYNSCIAALIKHHKNCYYSALAGEQVIRIQNPTKIRFEEIKPKDLSADKFLNSLLDYEELRTVKENFEKKWKKLLPSHLIFLMTILSLLYIKIGSGY